MKLFYTVFGLILTTSCLAQPCKNTEKKQSKFDGTTTYTNMVPGPLMNMNPNDVRLITVGKVVSSADTVYTLTIYKPSTSVPETSRQGVTLLFNDNSRLDKPEEPVKVEVISLQYYMVTTLALTPKEFSELGKKTLTDVRLINSEGAVPPKLGKSLIAFANCMLQTW